jgi:putative tryptophan/tyrosine transport system substrate-binding protein
VAEVRAKIKPPNPNPPSPGRIPLRQLLRKGLRESGYAERLNYAIEHRWAEGHPERLPELARDLTARATVIATYDTASALAAKAVTTTIPIVFAMAATRSSSGWSRALPGRAKMLLA